ncbi:hypothetical protein GCM10011297_07210 [Bacterioplanes sanyensis]|nr:hypothetical protein GCM10011297_07210 [Bacterioplanes sanyensis]
MCKITKTSLRVTVCFLAVNSHASLRVTVCFLLGDGDQGGTGGSTTGGDSQSSATAPTETDQGAQSDAGASVNQPLGGGKGGLL